MTQVWKINSKSAATKCRKEVTARKVVRRDGSFGDSLSDADVEKRIVALEAYQKGLKRVIGGSRVDAFQRAVETSARSAAGLVADGVDQAVAAQGQAMAEVVRTEHAETRKQNKEMHEATQALLRRLSATSEGALQKEADKLAAAELNKSYKGAVAACGKRDKALEVKTRLLAVVVGRGLVQRQAKATEEYTRTLMLANDAIDAFCTKYPMDECEKLRASLLDRLGSSCASAVGASSSVASAVGASPSAAGTPSAAA